MNAQVPMLTCGMVLYGARWIKSAKHGYTWTGLKVSTWASIFIFFRLDAYMQKKIKIPPLSRSFILKGCTDIQIKRYLQSSVPTLDALLTLYPELSSLKSCRRSALKSSHLNYSHPVRTWPDQSASLLEKEAAAMRKGFVVIKNKKPRSGWRGFFRSVRF